MPFAELQERTGAGTLSTPVLLGPSRVIAPPPWMDPVARGVNARDHDSFPLAAFGYNGDQAVGVLAFDVRDHLLLDPDRMDALVLTIDMLQRLVAPRDLMIEPTGSFVTVSAGAACAAGRARRNDPSSVSDQWGRVRFRALESGRYLVTSDGPAIAIYANYYDAAESDLSAAAAPPERPSTTEAVVAGPAQPGCGRSCCRW